MPRTLAATLAPDAAADAGSRLSEVVTRLFARTVDGLPRCTDICGTAPCVFRSDAGALVATTTHAADMRRAVMGGDGESAAAAWWAATNAGNLLVAFPPTGTPPHDPRHVAAVRASLCFAQQAALAAPEWPVRDVVTAIYLIRAQSAKEERHG